MFVYLIPGLGFDCRIFENLQWHPDHTIIPLNWVDPDDQEDFKSYANRFAQQMTHRSNVAIVGHSLGGMLALEIANHRSIEKVILISSVKSRQELPLLFKIVKPLKIELLFTKKMVLSTFRFWATNHGYITAEEQNLFKNMVTNASNKYLRWALKELSKWRTPQSPLISEVFQIHGTKDKTFPLSEVDEPFFVIEGGTHFMVYNRSEEINLILGSLLKKPAKLDSA